MAPTAVAVPRWTFPPRYQALPGNEDQCPSSEPQVEHAQGVVAEKDVDGADHALADGDPKQALTKVNLENATYVADQIRRRYEGDGDAY